MAKIAEVEDGLERYYAYGYAVDHHPGDPDAIVRIWWITERAITQVSGWTPRLLEHIRRLRRLDTGSP